MGHVGVGWGSCRGWWGGVGHVFGVGWGGSCRGGVGHSGWVGLLLPEGWGDMVMYLGWGGVGHGVGWVM